jgi:outer membrane lipoprotein-sorting protein
MVTTAAGMSQQTTKVWLKGNMMRTEMTAEGTTIISIYNSDEETAYAYYPDMGMVMVITYQPQESAADETEGVTNYSPTILGTENYDGKVCLVIQYTYEGTTTKMWIWKQYGFTIKMEVTSSEGTYTVEYKNIVFNSVTDDVFVLPSGLTTMTVQV